MGVTGVRGGPPGQVHSSTDRHLFVGCLQHRLRRELDGPGAEAQGKSGVATGTITWREGPFRSQTTLRKGGKPPSSELRQEWHPPR